MRTVDGEHFQQNYIFLVAFFTCENKHKKYLIVGPKYPFH